MPTEFVRVRDPNANTEVSLPRRRAEQLAADGDVKILDGVEAVDLFGQPLPPAAATETAGAKRKEQTR